MNEIKIFNNPDFGDIRTTMRDGEPLFVAADICKALDIGNPTQAMTRLDPDESTLISNEGGREVNAVTESGLYALVLGSRKPEARQFKRWVTHDVIPTIRRHGAYMTPETIEAALSDPDTIIRLATDLKAERTRRQALEAQAEEDKPKVLFADAVSASQTSILVGDLAKLLRQNGVDIGQNRLFQQLRDDGFLIKSGERRNMPTQRYMDSGLFQIKETSISNPDGSIRVTRTVKVTGKGQQYFINRYLSR